MKNALGISVKEPCSEKFENFSKTSKGGFCNTCEKEVIDFTIMSEIEVRDHFNDGKGKTCGRFKKSQLETTYLVGNSPSSFSKSIGTMAFSLLSLCAISNMEAQKTAALHIPLQTEISAIQNQTFHTIKAEGKYTVRGTVLDEDNLPLPGVNIVLKGTSEGVVTDIDGKFEFSRTLEADDVLVFSYLGYDSKEYIVPENKSDVLDITIVFDAVDVELMGEVVVGGAYKSKRNIFQKFIGLFK